MEYLGTIDKIISIYSKVFQSSYTLTLIILRSRVLIDSARKEFEQAKYERDPLIIAQLLLVGRDCLNQSIDKVFIIFIISLLFKYLLLNLSV